MVRVLPVPRALPRPQRYPFVWYPLAGQRHAIDRNDAQKPMGEAVRTLCGQVHPRIPVDELKWLWCTCEPCWEAACQMIGIERRPAQSPISTRE